jgi:hypothetical protein
MSPIKTAVLGFSSGMLGAVVALSAAGAAPQVRPKAKPKASPAVVEAREFRLVDAQGKTQGTWHVEETGSAFVLNHMGKPKIIISVEADGSTALMLGTNANEARVNLTTLKGEKAALSLQDKGGRLTAGMAPSGKMGMEVVDASGGVVFQAIK